MLQTCLPMLPHERVVASSLVWYLFLSVRLEFFNIHSTKTTSPTGLPTVWKCWIKGHAKHAEQFCISGEKSFVGFTAGGRPALQVRWTRLTLQSWCVWAQHMLTHCSARADTWSCISTWQTLRKKCGSCSIWNFRCWQEYLIGTTYSVISRKLSGTIRKEEKKKKQSEGDCEVELICKTSYSLKSALQSPHVELTPRKCSGQHWSSVSQESYPSFHG